MENADTLEEVEALDADRHGSGVNVAEASLDAGRLLVKGLAEELQSDVPALFSGPAEIVAGVGSKAIPQIAENGGGLCGERDGDEEPHAAVEDASIVVCGVR